VSPQPEDDPDVDRIIEGAVRATKPPPPPPPPPPEE
jgi:hypothetical protein